MRADEFLGQVAVKPPFSKMHPKIAAFFRDYISCEKVVKFEDTFVLNTHFPPYPSHAFDNMVKHFHQIGEVAERSLYSVTLGVTNRCTYNCWHCYNAGRSQRDIPLSSFKEIAAQLQTLETVRVTVSGGEPLLRDDLEEIAGAFDDTTSLNLNTTGEGLTKERACALRENGVFALGVSIDSNQPDEHDRLRGKKGAFETALQALRLASENSLYPYIITVATHEFLQPQRFYSFMKFAAETGALEVHLLEPSATGKLAGQSNVLLSEAERQQIIHYHKDVAQDDDLPILSTFQPLLDILTRMDDHFRKPRTHCVGHLLASHMPEGPLPTPPEISEVICERHLPRSHSVPLFFQIRAEAQETVGKEELRLAYDGIHEDYDEFWLSEAGSPIEALVAKLSFQGEKTVLEAGCGTGFATVLIAGKLKEPDRLTAVDLSEGMLVEARRRARTRGIHGIKFIKADALDILSADGPFDIVFSSWVLGYIPLKSFFAATQRALARNGQLAFIVHKENSPRDELAIFWELIAKDPSALLKRVSFDFPRDIDHVRQEITSAGMEVLDLCDGKITFHYDTPEEVLQHLLKSGAGTAFYEAIDPNKRVALEKEFLKCLADRRRNSPIYDVSHDYIMCIARNP
jgi:MoaA/NifB/PqqE/SkfB family radical SAM enzyme/cyclopropane fatty-acyl-phospholipid synthase-like methyltransferase